MAKEKQPKDTAKQGKEIKTAADLIQDEHNYRKHSDTNKARIKKSIDEAEGWGVEWPKSAINNYSRKIEIPTYEPVEGVVELSELTDKTKYEQLCNEIDAAEIDSDIAEFLKMAATRHIVFDYARIGDYYANASPEVQDLMERSALVIIDFAKAVENGFVKLTQELTDMCEAQRMEDEK